MDKLAHEAMQAIRAARELGFDHLHVTAAHRKLFGVRIAQGVVCRENVWRESETVEATGGWRGREGAFEAADDVPARLAALRAELERQAPDKELVPPEPPAGAVRWEPASGAFEERYAPELVYPVIERHAARVRGEGLRITGYLEARETAAHTATLGGFALSTRDHGATFTVTVDDPRTGAVGTTQRAATQLAAAGDDLDALIGAAVEEAAATCRASAAPAALEPGDYTVVLHPAAALDIVQATLNYELFDRRKIEEGRTYLARAREELHFPEDLVVEQTLSLPLPRGGTYADLPLGGRLTPCESLRLIEGGRVRDLHTSAYWAKARGGRETFGAHDAPPLRLASTRPTHATLDALVKDTERGVLVLNTWYLRMVAEMDGVITGMTRDGLFEIKDGRIGRPLVNMRWHENPLRVLSAVTGVTEDSRLFGLARLAGQGRQGLAAMPAVRVEGFHFSSATKF